MQTNACDSIILIRLSAPCQMVVHYSISLTMVSTQKLISLGDPLKSTNNTQIQDYESD
jgi:hypothetical protein